MDNDSILPHPARQPLRRPLVGIALGFILGTAGGLLADVNPETILLCALVVSLGALAFAARAPILVYVLSLLVGWFNASLTARHPSERELRSLMARPREYVSVEGVVCDDPAVSAGRRPDEELRTFSLRVEGICRAGGWEQARGTVSVTWKTPTGQRPVHYGDRWRLSGLLSWHGAMDGVDEILPGYSMEIDAPSAAFLSGGHGSRIIAWCLRARQRCFNVLGWGLDAYPEEAGLLRALMLGYRQEMSDRLYRAFSTTGTLHVVAISGMHVAIFSLLLVAVLKAAGLSRQHWIYCVAPVVILYTIGTGLYASAVRACVMALIFWSAPAFRRRPDGPVALAAAAIAILAVAPEQLLDLGFIFSFVAVAGLMILYPLLMKPIRPRLAADPWIVQPEPLWKRRARGALLEIASVGAASVSAWLITTPLTAYCFNLVSPVSLLSNLLVIPLSFAVLLSGVLALLSGSFSVVLAEVFNHASRVFIDWMLWWVEWTAQLPGSYSYVRSPAPLAVAAWYVVLGLWLLARGAVRRWVLAGAAVALVAAVAVQRGRDDRIEVDVFDVGQGSAAFVNVPGSGDVLVDAGPRFCARRIVRQLRKNGVDRLRALVVSHGDADHIGAAAEILDAVPVSEIWCPPSAGRSSVCRQLFAEARRQGVPVRRVRFGDTGPLGGGAEWEVLHPSGAEAYRRGDDGCVVMRIALNASSVLFMGDAGAGVEEEILGRPVEPSASVLIAGNHGAADTCRSAWLDAVAPSLAVVSVGEDNAVGAPDKNVLSRLSSRGAQIVRTDEEGGVRVVFDRSGRAAEATPLPPIR